jgi:hypothetical protein
MKQSPAPPLRPDNRLVACQNDFAVLKLIHEFGHLRRSEIGRGVWPRSPPTYALKITRRVVRRLLERRLLLERLNGLGGHSLVLSSRGAHRLQEIDVIAQNGYDLSNVLGPQFFHRTLGTCYLIERASLGEKVYGEYSIITGRGLIGRGELSQRFGKIPDGLITVPGSTRGLDASLRAADWLEVESSYKRGADLDRIFRTLYRVGQFLDLRETVVLDRVLFLYNATQRHERMLLAHIQRYLREHPVANAEAILDSLVFVSCDIGLPLVFRGYTERTALELLSERLYSSRPVREY